MTTVPSPTPATPPFAGFAAGDVPGFDILNTCVQCGLCLPTCPTYRETYREQSSPRGRLHLMRAVHDGRIDVLDRVFTEQMYECLDCRACEPACPSGVAYGKVLEASRSQIERARAEREDRSLPERALRKIVFGWLFREPARVRAVSALARAYQRGGVQRLARGSGILRAFRLDRLEGQLPRISRSFFAAEGQVYPTIGERRGRVGLLTGCMMHTAYAGVHRATVRVLTRNGWEVAVPKEQGCCGALHVHAGETDGGRELMRRNIAAFEAAGVDLIVNNAAGCGAAMKEYGHLLRDDPAWAARAAAFSAGVRDVTEILADAPLRGDLRPLNLTVTYQEPCHLAHAQRIVAQPRALLRAIPGLKLVEMAESSLCCGSAGSYSVTQPEMSARLLDRKLTHALATEPAVIVSANPGCMLQLQAGLRQRDITDVQVRHIVEVIDAAYGG
jgi:glycolate oxidase iron-sulfur subunit